MKLEIQWHKLVAQGASQFVGLVGSYWGAGAEIRAWEGYFRQKSQNHCINRHP